LVSLDAVIPGPERSEEPGIHIHSHPDNDSGLQERHYQRLWIPGSRFARPGMTMGGSA
jgi:hypothetical protein